MIDANDVQRTFEAWLALAKDQEVLVLADLVNNALRRRGYSMRCEWVKPVRGQVEPSEKKAGLPGTSEPAPGGPARS